MADYVTAVYKTGAYIGKLIDRTETRLVVEVLAVARHPEQGDLHHPYQADVPFFHQRKALAFRERALVYSNQVEPWLGDVPEYADSLLVAFDQEKARMQALSESGNPWAERALTELRNLAEEYKQQGILK